MEFPPDQNPHSHSIRPVPIRNLCLKKTVTVKSEASRRQLRRFNLHVMKCIIGSWERLEGGNTVLIHNNDIYINYHLFQMGSPWPGAMCGWTGQV